MGPTHRRPPGTTTSSMLVYILPGGRLEARIGLRLSARAPFIAVVNLAPRAAGVEIGRLLQASAEPAADGGPGLPRPILRIADQPVLLSRGVQRVLDLALLERAGGDPAPQRPRGVVDRRLPGQGTGLSR